MLAAQCRLLAEVTALAREQKAFLPTAGDGELLQGLLELTEAIADATANVAKQPGLANDLPP